MIGWILVSIVAAIAIWPFVAEALRPRVSQFERDAAPGQLADLSKGKTYFEWRGPADGPVAVCVHGLTTPSFVWEPIADHLAQRGFRVLTYDLYGRGLSDCPKGDQDSDFFNTQLNDLLAHQGITEPFTLLGYSMGGAIGASYAAAHPEKIRQLCIIAPAGLGHDLGPVADLAINRDWLGKWMMLWLYPRSLRRATEEERGLPSAIPNMVDRQIAKTRKRGFAPAILSSLRGLMSEDFEPYHRAIATANIPTLAIWGEEDEVIPLSCRDQMQDWNPDARHVVIPGAGHTVAYSHVEEVTEALDTLDL